MRDHVGGVATLVLDAFGSASLAPVPLSEVLPVVDSLQLTSTHTVSTPVSWREGEDVIVSSSVSDDEARKLRQVGIAGRISGSCRLRPGGNRAQGPPRRRSTTRSYTAEASDGYATIA